MRRPDDGEAWLRAARARRCPEADDRTCGPTALRGADYALVWKPPPRAVRSASAVQRAIFNLGAGVDVAARACRRCRDDVPVIRLEDAGMAAQMAEYVTLAVLRAYREPLDATRAQQREGRWQQRDRARRSRIRRRRAGLRRARRRRSRAALAPFGFPLCAGARTPQARSTGVDVVRGPTRAARRSSPRLASWSALLPSTPATRGTCSTGRRCRGCRAARTSSTSRRGALVVDAGSDRAARRRPPRWRDARRVPRRAAARRTSVLASSADHADAARVGGDPASTIRSRRSPRRSGALERGEPVSGVVDRARGY